MAILAIGFLMQLFIFGVIGLFLVYHIIMWLISYFFRSIGLSCIAKRREVNSPRLAWIPWGNGLLLGRLADQYRAIHGLPKKNHESRLRALMIPHLISTFLPISVAVVTFVVDKGFFWNTAIQYISFMFIAAFVLNILYAKRLYPAYLDLFCSCNSQEIKPIPFAAIFFGYPIGIHVFACRKKDLGMQKINRLLCTNCNTEIKYTDCSLEFRSQYVDGYICCPICKTPLHHSEELSIDASQPTAISIPQSTDNETATSQICPQCGQTFAENDLFCSQCGTKR